MDLVPNVLVGEMNLALVTAPSEEERITGVRFARRLLYAVLPHFHRPLRSVTYVSGRSLKSVIYKPAKLT